MTEKEKAKREEVRALLQEGKCRGHGVKFLGYDIDPCEYELKQAFRNVTVEVLQCKKCGHVEISWKRQDNTEVIENDKL